MEPVAPDVAAAPAVATLAGRTLSIEASAWRDFQPGEGAGAPLRVTVRIVGAGRAPVDRMAIDAVWTVRRGEAWSTSTLDRRVDPSGALEAVASDGPDWAPGDRVDVIARIRDDEGVSVLLRAPSIAIERTE